MLGSLSSPQSCDPAWLGSSDFPGRHSLAAPSSPFGPPEVPVPPGAKETCDGRAMRQDPEVGSWDFPRKANGASSRHNIYAEMLEF